MQKKLSLRKEDWQQLGLNVLAFIVFLFAIGGKGSFWGFATFTLLSLNNLTEFVVFISMCYFKKMLEFVIYC